METIFACGRSERTKTACAWPGRVQSETYRPRPLSMRSSSSLPFSISGLRHRHQDAARRLVEHRGADRALPPARRERRVLVVAEHDQVDAERLGEAADL